MAVDINTVKHTRIEGYDNILKFMRDRETKMKAESADGPSLIELSDGRVMLEKRIPTGFIQPASKVAVPTTEQAQAWAKEVGVEWDKDFEKPELRVIPWRASDERADRHGDIVRQRFKYDNFKMNPVLLECHKWESPPIGNVIHWELTSITSQDYSGPATMFYNLFATAAMSPNADSLYRLAKARLLRAGSIGFFPLIVVYIESDADRQALGLGRWGVIYEESEMMEFSVCSIPANPAAVQNSIRRAIHQKQVEPDDCITMLRLLEEGKDMFHSSDDADQMFDAIAATFQEIAPKQTLVPLALDADKRIKQLEEGNQQLQQCIVDMQKTLTSLTGTISSTAKAMKDGLLAIYDNQVVLNDGETQPPKKAEEEDDDKDDFDDVAADLAVGAEKDEDEIDIVDIVPDDSDEAPDLTGEED